MKTRFLKLLKWIARKNCIIQFYPKYKCYIIIRRFSPNRKYFEIYSSVQRIYRWQSSILDASYLDKLNDAINMLPIARNRLTLEYAQTIKAYHLNKKLKKL